MQPRAPSAVGSGRRAFWATRASTGWLKQACPPYSDRGTKGGDRSQKQTGWACGLCSGLGICCPGCWEGREAVRGGGRAAGRTSARAPPSVAGPVACTHCMAALAGLRALGTHHTICEDSVGTDSSHGAREQKFGRFVLPALWLVSFIRLPGLPPCRMSFHRHEGWLLLRAG